MQSPEYSKRPAPGLDEGLDAVGAVGMDHRTPVGVHLHDCGRLLHGLASAQEHHAFFTACTAVGKFAAIASAMRITAGISSAGGWTSLTMPRRHASAAVIGSPIISICMALPEEALQRRNR